MQYRVIPAAVLTAATILVAPVPTGAATQVPHNGSQSPANELREVDIIGACQKVGVGFVYIKLHCGDKEISACDSRISQENAAVALVSRDVARLDIKVGTPPYSVDIDTLNSAAARSCDSGADVKLAKIEMWNTFTFSGVQLDSCSATVGAGGGGSAGSGGATISGSANASVTCKIKTREDTMTDTRPASCTDCSKLNNDVYHYNGRWSLGVISRFRHEAQGRFTGYDGSAVQVSTVVDFGL